MIFALQPNGLLALFDTETSSFIVLNCTVPMALDLGEEHFPSDGYHEVRLGLHDEPIDIAEKSPKGLARWTHCIERVRQAHGEKLVKDCIAKASADSV
jgi:hypothetical protein